MEKAALQMRGHTARDDTEEKLHCKGERRGRGGLSGRSRETKPGRLGKEILAEGVQGEED